MPDNRLVSEGHRFSGCGRAVYRGQQRRSACIIGVLAIAVLGLSACGSGGNSGTGNTQSPSYKDGVATADQVYGNPSDNPDGVSNAVWSVQAAGCDPSTGSCQFDSGDGSGAQYSSAFCGVYVNQMPAGDNRSEWMQGCIAEYQTDVSNYMHPG
jgi:hypothetical protein